MQWSFPAEWEEHLWAAARRLLPPGALDPRALAAAVTDRSRRFTSERDRLHTALPAEQAARDLAARALFFTVADAAKMGVVLAELASRSAVPATPALRVLDAGAGCGAMTWGIAAALPGRELIVDAVDRDGPALALMAEVARLAGLSRLRTHQADLAHIPGGPYDLIVAGTCLNEVPETRRVALTRGWLAHLADDGALVLIEPALRETARPLHELRDALLTAGDATVFAPCTRAQARCPALDDERDWCHEDRPFAPPPRLAQLARQTGLRTGGLKFAYLTLRRAPGRVVDEPGALRVVSDAVDQKGTWERWVCGDDGRQRLRVLRRDRGPENQALPDSRRGDVIVRAADGTLRLIRPAEEGSS